MSHARKLAITYASLSLGALDIVVGLVAARTDTLHQISLLKIGGAILLQAIFIAEVWAGLEWTSGLPAALVQAPQIRRLAALAIAIPFVLLTIVSTSLLYNGVACGEYPFVLHQNRPLCNSPRHNVEAPNPSIERTPAGKLRLPAVAAHVKR